MVTELKIVSGDPALDLVNTVGDDRVPDPLDHYESFAEWAARVGAIDETTARRLATRGRERPARAERALAEARDLRAVMDAVFRPLAKGAGGPSQEALARLVALAGAAVERGRLEAADGGFRLVWGGDHLERPLWPLAAAARRPAALRAARSPEGVRRLPVALPRHQPQPQSPLVHDGRLRQPQQDAPLSRAARYGRSMIT